MTVCIAAIAGWHGHTAAHGVVAVTDHMLSMDRAGALEGYESPWPKSFQFGESIIALYAGAAANAGELQQRVRDRIARGTAPVGAPRLTVREVADIFGTMSVQFFQDNFQRAELDSINTTIAKLHSRDSKLDPELVQKLRYAFRQAGTEVDWIIAGVDKKGPHLFWVSPRGEVETRTAEAFLAIGEGCEVANYELLKVPSPMDGAAGGHYSNRGLGETLYNLYHAKRSAEVVHSVGRELTTIITVDGSGCRYASDYEGSNLFLLRAEYEHRRSLERRHYMDAGRLLALQNAAVAMQQQTAIPEHRANPSTQAAAYPSDASNPTSSGSDHT